MVRFAGKVVLSALAGLLLALTVFGLAFMFGLYP